MAGGSIPWTRILDSDRFSTGAVWTPDSSHVVYVADQDTDDVYELYISTADGVINTKPTPPLPAAGDVEIAILARDGSKVFYVAQQDTAGVSELYSVPLPGVGPSTKLSGEMTTLGDVISLVNVR